MHPVEQALIVNCEIEASYGNDYETDFVGKSKEIQKIIRLKSLEETSDIDPIVSQVINKSKGLLTESHRNELRHSILYLKNRQSVPSKTSTGTMIESLRPKTAGARMPDKQLNYSNGITSSLSQKQLFNQSSPSIDSFTRDISRSISLSSMAGSEPSVNNLNDYTELLYEELPEKIRGTAMVYELSKDHDNLVLIIEREPLICALARLLREEGRKSIDLSSLIVGIFANLSVFSQFHSTITKFKVGSICLELIRIELEKEMSIFRELAETQKMMANDNHLTESFSINSALDKSNAFAFSPPQSQHNGTALAAGYEKSIKKYQTLVAKQNLFLRAAFFLLLNLSADKNIEMKMASKGIVLLMVKVLERENWADLLNVVLLFLKKLSIYEENKEIMVHLGISGRLANIIENFTSPGSSPQVKTALEVMHNLAFDQKFRHEIIGIGIIQRLLQFLFKTKFQFPELERLTYQVMYVISSEEKIRIMFNMATCSNTNCVNILGNRLVKFLEDLGKYPSIELLALLINLSTNRRNAQLLGEQDFIRKLLAKIVSSSLKHEDILILKLLRNISQHEGSFKIIFAEFVTELVRLFVRKKPTPISEKIADEDEDEDLAVIEVLGILGNLENVPGINWLGINQKLDFWTKIEEILTVRQDFVDFEDDLILECILVISVMSSQKECCLYLVKQRIAKLLTDLLNLRQKDDEIVLQILYVFHLLLRYEDARRALLQDPVHILKYFLDLLNDNNPEIKKVCKQSLTIIMEFEEEYAEVIKEEKFKSHNKQWLEMVSRDEVDQFVDEAESDYLNDLAAGNYSFLVKTEFSDSDNDLPSKNNSKHSSRPQTGYKTRPSTARASSRSANRVG